MKTAKRYRYLPLIYLPIVFGLLYAGLKYASHYMLLPYAILGWLTLALSLLVITSPYGRTYLQTQEKTDKRFGFKRWIALICLLQLSLLGTFSGLHQVIFHLLPIQIEYVSLASTLRDIEQSWGLYPWGGIGLLASYLAFTSYNNNTHAFLSTTLVPLFKNKETSLITHLTQITTRNLTVSTTAMTLCLYLLFTTLVFTHGKLTYLPHGMNNAAYLTAMALLLLAFMPFVKNGLFKLLQRRIPTVVGLCSLLAISALVVIFVGTLMSTLPPSAASTTTPLPLASLIQKLPLHYLWFVFSANWWLGMVPMSAVLIAYYSKGYRVDQVLAATLALPLLLSLIDLGLTRWLPSAHYDLPPSLSLSLSALGFIVLFALMTTQRTRSFFVLSYLPKRGMQKHRDHHFFFRRTFRYAIAMLYLYLPVGLTYLAVILLMLGSAFFILLLCMLAGYVIAMIRGKKPSK